MLSEDLRYTVGAVWADGHRAIVFLIFYRLPEAVSVLCNHLQATLIAYGECSLSWNYNNKKMWENICDVYKLRMWEPQWRTSKLAVAVGN